MNTFDTVSCKAVEATEFPKCCEQVTVISKPTWVSTGCGNEIRQSLVDVQAGNS